MKFPKTLKFIRVPPTPTTAVRRSSKPFDATEYIEDRRCGREGHAAIPALDWFDHLFEISHTLRAHGIDPRKFARAMDLIGADIDAACLQLLESLVANQTITKKENAPTRRRLVVPEGLIRHLTLFLFEVLYLERRLLPEALVVLLRELLGGTKTELIQEHLPENSRQKELAAQIIAQIPDIGVRRLAKILDMSPSTITRWYRQKDFQGELNLWKSIFGEPRSRQRKRSRKKTR